MEKSTESSKIQGFQSKKYDATIRGNRCLSIPHPLLNLDLTGNEFKAMVKLWNWFQSPDVKGLKFITSRAHLAKLASISEDTAKHTLQKLKRAGAIKAVSIDFGVSTYEWNCGYLRGGVTEIQSGGDWKSSGPWMKIIRPLDKNHPASIICTLFIPLYLPSYTAFSRHVPNVDNYKDAASASISDLKDALRAGFPKETIKVALQAGLPIKNLIALGDSILNLWITANRGGTFWLVDIVILLQTFQIDLFKTENITGYMLSLLKDGEPLHKARKKIPNFFDNDEALFESYLTMHEKHEEEKHGKEN